MSATATTTATTTTDLPTVGLTFACREGRKTKWIEGEYPVFNDGTDQRPEVLFADLIADGWVLDQMLDQNLPPVRASHYDDSRPLGQRMIYLDHKVKQFSLSKPGTALFGGWTDDEARTFTRTARNILRRHGFHRVPLWKKTLADML